jgi:uncharacterized protein
VIVDTASKRRTLLDSAKKVAVVGASDNPARASFFVLRYLRTHGYTVWPVNPTHASVDGLQCYPSLSVLAAQCGIPDIVDVFRRPDALAAVAEEAISIGVPAIWFQYGVVNANAIRRADEAGLRVVVDRCMKVEHARFAGGLSMAGMDSGVITAKKRA